MSRYIVGIDLGTTNSALAYVDAATLVEDEPVAVSVFEIPQLVQASSVLARAGLPSFLYLSQPGELPAGALDLPWAKDRSYGVGAFARERGAQVPLHAVSSAKSWLCHAGVDRRGAILPFQAPKEVEKISPIAASTRYLEHLRDAWDAAHPEDRLGAQQVFLTVPASFDAVARDLTLEAASAAGLTAVTLLEEPQAAFYAWLSKSGDAWRKTLRAGDRVLVADVGGGTTDFSLIAVVDKGGDLSLERLAVGEHILLGGDNMDLALAAQLNGQLAADGKKLDAGQQRALVAAARDAKEKLLGDASLDRAPITILGRGSKLIGNKIQTELSRKAVEQILVEGFLPKVDRGAEPETRRRAGFLELGLPFAVETGITKHLAQFLRRHEVTPTHLLFNGGVFNSLTLRARLLEVTGGWAAAPKELPGADYDLAVARGAAYFGAVKLGKGIRIRGGTARSYYVGIETAMPSIPGVAPPIRALCVVPFGMEEGTEAEVPSGELGLVVGEPVEFRFLSSTRRKDDHIGDVLDEYTWPDHLEETAPAAATLEAESLKPGTLVPVKLEVKVTDIGTVELWSKHTQGPERWRLVWSVRETQPEAPPEAAEG